MPRFAYPVMLEPAGRRCVIVGERAVEEGKLDALLEAGADEVVVLTVGPCARVDALGSDARIRAERRRWRPADLDGALLVIGWDPDPRERDRLAAEARARGVLVNVIDDVAGCDFAAPAVVRRGDLVVAIGTGGRSPALARKLRQELGRRFGPGWAELVEVLRDVRASIRPLVQDAAERSRRWNRALDLEEAERLIDQGRAQELRARLIARLAGTEASP
ncbi:MAG: bifunctional precorrin-2 dehydrogenase/sirohydrochlorin ferrochelatase [Candidatus Velamenicoccus archaeovorus]